MFITSTDLLNLVVAICAIWLTVFLCWALFYIAMILKKFNNTLERVSTTIYLFDQLISSAKSKVDGIGQTISTVVRVVSDLVNVTKKTKTTKKTK